MDRLRLKDVRAIYRLIGDIRSMGSEPSKWRGHLVRRVRKLFDAAIVVSSEVHVRTVPAHPKNDIVRVIDAGWGFDGGSEVWQIQTDMLARPEEFMLQLLRTKNPNPPNPDMEIPVLPAPPLRGGKSFVLSQYPLPHLGAVDQLGIHKDSSQDPFTATQHRLIRLFHLELGRLWTRDALLKARDPSAQLAPRLAQTLAALQSGCSEKEVSQRLGISRHTVHNYVKALHHRLGVSSRGELLAKTAQSNTPFLPQFSVRK